MAGSPYETLEDIEKTHEFIKKYFGNNFIIYQTFPYPQTGLWDYALKNGIVDDNIFEKEVKNFFETDFKYLLTKEIPKEEFKKKFNEIRNERIEIYRDIYLSNIKNINFEVLKSFFSVPFIKKAWSLRKRFLNKMKKRK